MEATVQGLGCEEVGLGDKGADADMYVWLGAKCPQVSSNGVCRAQGRRVQARVLGVRVEGAGCEEVGRR